MFDMSAMMGKIQEAQAKLKEAQESLVNVTAEGEAGRSGRTRTGLIKLSARLFPYEG